MSLKIRKFVLLFISVLIVFIGAPLSARAVKEGGERSFLALHSKGPRLAIVTSRGVHTPLIAPQLERADPLEAIAAIPGEEGGYLVTTARGDCFPIWLDGLAVRVGEPFLLPAPDSEVRIEALALRANRDGSVTLVWGHRPSAHGDEAPWFCTAKVNLEDWSLSEVSRYQAYMPQPVDDSDVRGISDLAIRADGQLFYLASGADSGLLNRAGVLNEEGEYAPLASVAVAWDPGHRPAALEIGSGGRIWVATDDDDRGATIYEVSLKSGIVNSYKVEGSGGITGLAEIRD